VDAGPGAAAPESSFPNRARTFSRHPIAASSGGEQQPAETDLTSPWSSMTKKHRTIGRVAGVNVSMEIRIRCAIEPVIDRRRTAATGSKAAVADGAGSTPQEP
jgi:hypothetical protein